MNTIIDYRSVISDNSDRVDFDEVVKDLIEKGWQPYGSPCGVGSWKISQAMVKYAIQVPAKVLLQEDTSKKPKVTRNALIIKPSDILID